MLKAVKPIDFQDLQFKLRCRIKVFDNAENTNFSQHCSLVACASRFGLIFVGTNLSNIQVIQLKNIEEYTKNDGTKADYPRRNIPLPSPPLHLSVNCEHTVLAVVTEKNNCCCALFYDVKSFWQQDVIQIGEVRLSATPGVQVREVGWNPALSPIFTACKSDGSLGVYEIKNSGIDINELPAAAGANCFCWSPKGKQIAVGSRDGKITQYKPDLQAVKVINAPPMKEPSTLLSLQWVSNYQFIGAFQPINPDGQTNFIVIDSPKTGDCAYTSYDDICYSNGNTRPMQFYLILIHNWNILMAASSNSMEVGILGNTGECWTQWIMGDSARAELPLTSKHQETLPIGCALDIGSTHPLPWGEFTLPPTPLLLLLSHHGVLCCFNVVYLKEGVPSICAPPDSIKDTSGLQHFITANVQSNINKGSHLKETNRTDLQKPTQIIPPNMETSKASSVGIISSTPATVVKTHPSAQTVSQGLNFSQNQAMNLFGGQVTLTPVTQSSKSSPQPSLTSKYQFIYPTVTTSESNIGTTAPVLQTAMPVSAVNSFTKSVASTSVTTTTSKLSQPEFGVIITPKLSQPEFGDNLYKNDVINVDLKAEEEAENIFAQMVKEECVFLESELKAVLHQGKSLRLNLGSDDEKTKIIESTMLLEEFFNEVVDICTTQNAEVHILKQNLLQSWAWYEEVKSRHLASEDESMMILIRAQPLDSASEKQLADIRHANYYLESQIAQAHHALDEQWENFQDYCKKKHKIEIPTMEMIFQTMVKQNAILRKQSYILKDIANRIKKSRSMFHPSLLISVEDHKNLTSELERLRVDPEDICQIHYERVTNRMRHFTEKKADVLRSFLKKREYSHVSALKPQLSTSIIQTSPSSKLKQSSLVAPKTPPALKEHIPKKLEFVQSTPKPLVERTEVTSSAIPPSTPIEGLQNFALKFEAKNFATLPEKTFTPLTKNVISGSPNSAFVSTFGSNTSISTSTTSSFKPTFLGVSPNAPTTTSSSFLKTFPSYSVTTTTMDKSQPVITISSNALSKPFSFANNSVPTNSLQTNMTTASKTSANSFSTATNKSSFSFNFQNVPSTTPANFGNSTGVKNLLPSTLPSGVTGTKSASSVAPVTPSVKLTTVGDASVSANVSAKPSSNFSFASTTNATVSVAPFSFSTASILGLTSQKPVETPASNATTKPFVFSSKTSTPITKSNSLITTVSKVNTPAQAVSFSLPTTSSVESTKVTTQSSVFTTSIVTITPKVTTQVISTATSSPAVFTSTQVSVPSLVGAFAATTPVESSVFNTSVTSAAPSSGFSVSGIKSASEPQISTSSSTVGSAAICPTTTTETTSVPSTIPATKVSSTSATAVTGIFTNQTATSTSQQSVSGSVFNAPTTQPAAFPSTTSSGGLIFGNTSSSKTSIFASSSDSSISKPLFGSVLSTTASNVGFGTTTTQSSIFGNAPSSTTSSSVFGGGPSTTVSATGFGTSAPTTTQSSLFGSVTSPVSATSLFGGATVTTTTPTASFGTSAVSTTQSTIFGSAVSSTTPSVFGGATPSTAQTVFGSPNQTSVFASAVVSTTPQSIFGNPPTSTTSQGFGIFGDVSQKSSIFGSAPTSSTQSSIFGNSSPSVFGNATSSSNSVFAQSRTSNTFGQQSVFGSTGSSFGSASIFGSSAPSFGQTSGSIFGSVPTTASGSIFGGTSTAGGTFGSSTSVFGTPVSSTSSPFGSNNLFSSPTTQNSFSANANTGSFGFGGLSVGSTATTSSSGFGATPVSNPFGGDNKSIFGSPSPSSTSSVFGSNTGSVFGNSSQSFGGGTFGSQPETQSSSFGQPSSFGQNSFGSGTFGQQPSGPFSSGSSAGVGQTGFGAASTFQKPAGFGSPPVFGGSPTFGSAPSFGGAPTFGNPPAFGTSPKLFGSNNTSAFGSSANNQNTAFGNLATQQTVGFGNLAQQAANAPSSNTPFSGNSSFSSWR